MISGPKFGSKAGKNMLGINALYGLKISGVYFRPFLAETMDEMVYQPSYSDPYLWLRPAVKPGGFEYCKYILCYIDDVLCISHNPRKLMKRIQVDFKLKDDNI